MKFLQIAGFLLGFHLVALGSFGQNITHLISTTYTIDSIKNGVLKITFIIKNNDTLDYFIPFIKPVDQYLKLSDKKTLKELDWGSDIYSLMSNNTISRNDLIEVGQIDSARFDDKKDSLFFFFKEPLVKKCYDNILTGYPNRKELYFVYPHFYHAVASGCLYIKGKETKALIGYLYIKQQIPKDDIIVSFDFNTDSIALYKENFFKYIPEKMAGYYLFKGEISLIQF